MQVMIQGSFRWLSIATLFLFLGNSLNAQVYSLDTVHLSDRDRIPIPEVSGEAYYLHAKPLRSPKTPGNKTRAGDWFNLNYSASNNFLVLRGPGKTPPILLENRFLYEGRVPSEKYYHFYYKGDGELMSEEEYGKINFSTVSQIRKVIAPYKLEIPRDVWLAFEDPYRWQHPNLYVVAYDNERKGYYKYRIVLTTYHDHSLSNANCLGWREAVDSLDCGANVSQLSRSPRSIIKELDKKSMCIL